MTKGQRAGDGAIAVNVEEGKSYFWCTCGISSKQPFCDGSHEGTDFLPEKVRSEEDKDILGHLLFISKSIAQQYNLNDNYRLVINNGAEAGQSVFHIHVHLLGGRGLNWPPG